MGPFILGLYDKKTTRAGAWAGMLTGFGLSIILCVGSGFNSALASTFGMCAMLASLVATFVVSRMTKPYEATFVQQFFDTEEAKAVQ
jgi:Na+(H+)/acetate symporter ActP